MTSHDDARLLLSRELDGDLVRDEVRVLHTHLAECGTCRAYTTELLAVEARLAALRDSDEAPLLSADFAARVTRAAAARPPRPWLIAATQRAGAWARTAPAAAAAGALAASLILWAVLPAAPPSHHVLLPRLQVQPIAWRETQDAVAWNHEYTVAPGHTLTKRVEIGDDQPYHIRLRSAGPLDVTLVHRDAATAREASDVVTGEGVRYASLHRPAPRDVVVIENRGAAALHVNLFTPRTDAIRVTVHRPTARVRPPSN